MKLFASVPGDKGVLMFGIGVPELIVILAVALVVIGPKKLPDLAKSLGKALGEFKRATNDLKQSIEQEAGLDEVRDTLSKTDRDIRRAFDPSTTRSASSADKPMTDPPDDATRLPEKEQPGQTPEPVLPSETSAASGEKGAASRSEQPGSDHPKGNGSA
jgi:sec-independent protein translocase protein TatB